MFIEVYTCFHGNHMNNVQLVFISQRFILVGFPNEVVDGLITHMSEFPVHTLVKGMLLLGNSLGLYAFLLTTILYFLSINVFHYIIISNDISQTTI